jgi:hypothetical protein
LGFAVLGTNLPCATVLRLHKPICIRRLKARRFQILYRDLKPALCGSSLNGISCMFVSGRLQKDDGFRQRAYRAVHPVTEAKTRSIRIRCGCRAAADPTTDVTRLGILAVLREEGFYRRPELLIGCHQ